MRVIVCGGRSFGDYACLEQTLDELHAATPITVLIHGAAPGADDMADTWARRKGLLIETFPAKWDVQGRAAGPIRNQQMIERSKADLVVAFPGNKGTADMVARAMKAEVKIVRVTASGCLVWNETEKRWDLHTEISPYGHQGNL